MIYAYRQSVFVFIFTFSSSFGQPPQSIFQYVQKIVQPFILPLMVTSHALKLTYVQEEPPISLLKHAISHAEGAYIGSCLGWEAGQYIALNMELYTSKDFALFVAAVCEIACCSLGGVFAMKYFNIHNEEQAIDMRHIELR
jgi:hypothetical protein